MQLIRFFFILILVALPKIFSISYCLALLLSFEPNHEKTCPHGFHPNCLAKPQTGYQEAVSLVKKWLQITQALISLCGYEG